MPRKRPQRVSHFPRTPEKTLHTEMEDDKLVYPGPYCKKAGYSLQPLLYGSPDDIQLTNGIALELYMYAKKKRLTSCSTSLVLRLAGVEPKDRTPPTLVNTVRMRLNRLHEKKKCMRREQQDELMLLPFHLKGLWSPCGRPKPPESLPLFISEMDTASESSGMPLQSLRTNGFTSEDDSRGGHGQVCCLMDGDERCQNQAGNASFSKRIEKTVTQRKLNLVRNDSVTHLYICDYHKNMIQRVRTKRKRKESMDGRVSPDPDDDHPEIDFFQMPVNALRKYKRHFKLSNRPGLNKSQLAEVCAKHFHTIPVNEKETTTYFFYMAKNYKNRLDQKGSELSTS